MEPDDRKGAYFLKELLELTQVRRVLKCVISRLVNIWMRLPVRSQRSRRVLLGGQTSSERLIRLSKKVVRKPMGDSVSANFTSLRSLSSRNPPNLHVIDAYLVSAR